MNVFCTVARLGKDAELRHLQNGTPVCQFDVAFDSGYGDNKVATWLRCALFGKRAESLFHHLTKGKQVGLSGEIKNEKWTDQSGAERTMLKMRVNEVTLLSRSESASASRNHETQPAGAGVQAAPTNNNGMPDFDDDIPF